MPAENEHDVTVIESLLAYVKWGLSKDVDSPYSVQV